MENDLISRKKITKKITEILADMAIRYFTGIEFSFDEMNQRIQKCLDEEPAAYDVDTVAARIKEMSGIQFDGKNESYQLDWCIDTMKAIEIIKEAAK